MAEHLLAGLNIVVTRPREQAADLARRIEGLGGKPLLFPLLEIAPAADQAALREQLAGLAQFDLAIFISPNAVKYGMAVLGTLPEGVRIATVGQGSAQALRELGISGIIAPIGRFDSEALLALPQLQDVSGWRVAILRGDGGRELLGDTLKGRDATVEYISCYQRGKPHFDVASLLAAAPDAITVTSSEALRHLWDMADQPARIRLAAIQLFVPHERIAGLARQQGWQRVAVAEAGDDGMTAALIAWANSQRKTNP